MSETARRYQRPPRRKNGRRPPREWPPITPDDWESMRVSVNSYHRKGWEILPPDETCPESLLTNREYCPRIRLTQLRREVLRVVTENRRGSYRHGESLADVVREIGADMGQRASILRVLEDLTWAKLLAAKRQGSRKAWYRVTRRGRMVLAGTKTEELPER